MLSKIILTSTVSAFFLSCGLNTSMVNSTELTDAWDYQKIDSLTKGSHIRARLMMNDNGKMRCLTDKADDTVANRDFLVAWDECVANGTDEKFAHQIWNIARNFVPAGMEPGAGTNHHVIYRTIEYRTRVGTSSAYRFLTTEVKTYKGSIPDKVILSSKDLSRSADYNFALSTRGKDYHFTVYPQTSSFITLEQQGIRTPNGMNDARCVLKWPDHNELVAYAKAGLNINDTCMSIDYREYKTSPNLRKIPK